MNVQDIEMVHTMLKKLREWRLHPQDAPRVVMMSGQGDKAFCAGSDIVTAYHDYQCDQGEAFHDEFLCDYAFATMKPM